MQAIECGLLGTCNMDSQHLQCPVQMTAFTQQVNIVMGTACQTLTSQHQEQFEQQTAYLPNVMHVGNKARHTPALVLLRCKSWPW